MGINLVYNFVSLGSKYILLPTVIILKFLNPSVPAVHHTIIPVLLAEAGQDQ